MKFEHIFTVEARVAAVADFHYRPSGLKSLTPPFAFMRFHTLPDYLTQNSVLIFSMWLGPIPIRWESHFPEVSESGFVDIQGEVGPFRSWTHRHTFSALESNLTEIRDQIEAHLHPNPWRAFVGLAMWLTLPILFFYRQRQTRHLLEK